jgi:beta-N-acetylhexosaminidase
VAEEKTAKEINILKDPMAEKENPKADKDEPEADKDEPEKADIRGSFTNVSASDDDAKKKGFLCTLRVEGTKEKTTTYDKASVKITGKTKILKQDGRERKEAKVEDIRKGCKVQIDFTGPVAESYPVQATAGTIVILEQAK